MRFSTILFIAGLFFVSCSTKEGTVKEEKDDFFTADTSQSFDGIHVPKGFSVKVFADSIGRGRDLIVAENGDVYALLRKAEDDAHCIAKLQDLDEDGKAEKLTYIKGACGKGSVKIHKGHLYFSSDSAVYRMKLIGDQPDTTAIEVIAKGFKYHGQHGNKNFAFDEQGYLYVNVGAPANACQEEMRTPGSPGMDPCPILEKYGGIWRFNDSIQYQDQMKDGYRYATGLRNCVAIDWNYSANKLYVVQHGRDQLHSFFPEHYDDTLNRDLPAEEFFLVNEGDDFGWPYCYYDPFLDEKVLAPEYGGDGQKVGRCDEKVDPIFAFPAHYAPNDLHFYQGKSFPEDFKNGAFVAFHGSWNRGPFEQEGFNVVFLPFEGSQPKGEDYFVFSDGYKGGKILSSRQAKYRPCGLAEGPDGSLYVIDSNIGRIWRITYTG